MTTRFLKYYIIIGLLVLILVSVLLYRSLPGYNYRSVLTRAEDWSAPSLAALPDTGPGTLIRYGKLLIENTAEYFGPKGSIARLNNGMNCQNCHLDAGTRPFANNFALVASSYPRFRERSGIVESVEFRINDCFKRSLNGDTLDVDSREMKAMAAYINWIGQGVDGKHPPAGTRVVPIADLPRPADPESGRQLYYNKQCHTCHGLNGEGLSKIDSSGYFYPPLWGPKSYNVSAGMYRITHLSNFIKYNMPFLAKPTSPQLTDEEAWDLGAFLLSQDRPEVFFKNDWPNINSKPVDYPFGPFPDSFPAIQHKYGPFPEIKMEREARKKTAVNP